MILFSFTNGLFIIAKQMFKRQCYEHRIKAGLGNPPEPFYANDVASQN